MIPNTSASYLSYLLDMLILLQMQANCRLRGRMSQFGSDSDEKIVEADSLKISRVMGI